MLVIPPSTPASVPSSLWRRNSLLSPWISLLFECRNNQNIDIAEEFCSAPRKKKNFPVNVAGTGNLASSWRVQILLRPRADPS
ncbi:MAG: hypothetical protein ABI471_01040 [Sphingomonas bacterium]